MAMLDLDKVINITSGGGGGGLYPGGDNPAPYPIVSQHIGLFNKPNAWDTDSNGWFGLLDNSNNGINAQNAQFNTQIAVAPVSGTGPLSTRVKSYDFSTNIDSVNSGKIKFTIHANTSKQIMYRKNGTYAIWTTTTLTPPDYYMPLHNDIYIVTTAGGNKYAITGALSVESLDVNNIKTNDVARIFQGDLPGNGWGSNSAHRDRTPVAVQGDVVTFAAMRQASGTYYFRFVQATLGDDGVFTPLTSVAESSVLQDGDYMSYYYYDGKVYLLNSDWGGFMHAKVYVYDIITELVTEIQMWQSGIYTHGTYERPTVVGFDGTLLVVITSAGYVYKGLNASSMVDQGPATSMGYKRGSVNVLQDIDEQIYISNNNFISIDGTTFPLNTTLSAQHIIEPLSQNNYDDMFYGYLFQPDRIIYDSVSNINIKLELNNNLLWQTPSNTIGSASFIESISVGQINNINTPNIEIELSKTGDMGIEQKLTLGATGGTFASPALPSNNGLSGTSTTKRESTVNSTDLYLTLA